MELGIALALITAAAVASVVVPLIIRARRQPERDAFDRAVYRDQLKDLERDLARGLIDAPEAASARLEIERRLLAADGRDEHVVETAGSPVLAVALALGVPMVGAILYLAMGSPGVADQPFAAQAAERPAGAAANAATADAATAPAKPAGHDDFAAGAAKLEAQLKQDPSDGQKWILLARTESEIGQWQKSVDAYRHVMALTNNSSDFASGYGEMLVLAAGGIVTPAAQQQFAAALAHDPGDVPSRYYTALGEAQAGHSKAAIAQWQALGADVPDEKIRAELQRRIAETAAEAGIPAPTLAPAKAVAAASGPTEQDIANAAQMSPADRQAMIRSMVDRLAARLQNSPNDLDGWQRLARAYTVLGEADKARAANEHVQTLLAPQGAQSPSAVAGLPAAPATAGVPGPTAQDVANAAQMSSADRQAMIHTMVDRLAAQMQTSPNDLEGWQRLARAYGVLGERDKALAAYEHVEKLLPADSDQRPLVAASIAALKGK